MAPRRSPTSSTGIRQLLPALLIVLALLYLALLPWLRRLQAETQRIERETLIKQAEADRTARLRGDLEADRAEVARNPGDARAQLQLALRCHEAGRLDEAAQHAGIAVGLQPGNPEPLLVLADIQNHAHRFYEAVRAYRAVLASSPTEPRALVGLSYLYISFGWPLEAEALLQPAVRALPQNLQMKVTLAMAYVQHEDYAAAERLLLEVRRLAPQDVQTWSPLVHLYNATRRYHDAVAVAHEALAKLPDDIPLLDEMGQSYYHLQDLPHAMMTFQKALAAEPDDPTAHYNLALCYRRVGDPPQAVREMEWVQQHNRGFAQTRYLLGQWYLEQHRETEGKRLLEEDRRVQAQVQKEARASLRVASRPRSADAHWQRALILQEDGDTAHALVEVEKTLELAPNHTEARRLLQTLQPANAGSHR
jgi:tetratricopeptide (TPR) repeat protein